MKELNIATIIVINIYKFHRLFLKQNLCLIHASNNDLINYQLKGKKKKLTTCTFG